MAFWPDGISSSEKKDGFVTGRIPFFKKTVFFFLWKNVCVRLNLFFGTASSGFFFWVCE